MTPNGIPETNRHINELLRSLCKCITCTCIYIIVLKQSTHTQTTLLAVLYDEKALLSCLSRHILSNISETYQLPYGDRERDFYSKISLSYSLLF